MVRIGLGCTLLERALNGGRLDGIGVYTSNLYEALRGSAANRVVPTCFPPKPWQRSLGNKLPGRIAFPHAYGISAAVSACTSLPFAGAREMAGHVDVFHAPDHLIPRLSKVPVVATICDALAVQRPDWIDAGIGRFRPFLVRSAARWANHVIAISQAMVPDLVQHFGISEKSISVVHMGIGHDWFERVPEAQRRALLGKYALTPGYLLFVGTLQPRKNVETIVAAYEALPEALRGSRQLVVAGQAGWGSESIVRRLGLSPPGGQCIWLDYLPPSEMKTLYQCASMFLFPSLSEGFGMPVLEAFASGIPVITSNVSSLPEVAADAAILVDPRSVAQLRDAIVRLADNADLAASLVEKGRKRAAQMSWETCAARTQEVYRRVV
jgi:glycosyltransferase involved in cell wall biosynthesis